ncbi:hypothetical protein BX616_006626 [Lobosporangium transversale]|nr:hypothetical protein BX616_006626 [Lobosporangium transversale]
MRNPVTLREGNMITAFRAEIPKLARDIYYRDEIGNISTSAILHQPDNILLTFKPRFPIFGGWNTTWYMGYNAPLNEYLRRVPGTDKYILKFPAVVPLAQTSYTDIDIRIILPEGAKNVNVQLPYEVDAVENSTTKTYMDSAGRHTVTIYAHNLIEEHGRLEMLVEYEYSASSYLIKPFAAASMLMVIFATSMVFSRLDFRIGQSVLKK